MLCDFILIIILFLISLFITIFHYDIYNDYYNKLATKTKKRFMNSSENTIKIMSFNIRKDYLDSNTTFNWEDRKDKVLTIITDYEPDILGLQEDTDNQREFFQQSKLLMNYSLIYSTKNNLTHFNNAILFKTSKFSLFDQGMYWLSETPEVYSKSWDGYVRTFTFAFLLNLQSNKPILVINTHLDHKSSLSRIKSAEQIVDFIKDYTNNYKRITKIECDIFINI